MVSWWNIYGLFLNPYYGFDYMFLFVEICPKFMSLIQVCAPNMAAALNAYEYADAFIY